MRKKLRSIDLKISLLLLLSALVISGCSSNDDDDDPTDAATAGVTPAETDSGAGTAGAGAADAGAGAGAGAADAGAGAADAGTADAGTADAGAADAGAADAGTADAGAADAGTADAGTADAGTAAADAGTADAGTADAGTADAGTADAGTADAGTADAGTADAGAADAGTADAGTADAGTADAGTTDAGTADAGTTDGGGTPITVGAAGCAALSATGDSSSIAGLYDLTKTTDGIQDVAYMTIAENGSITFYDYQQDDKDQGDNCYNITSGVAVVSAKENDQFVRTSYIDADANCEILTEEGTIVLNESEIETVLSSTFPDLDDEDNDGDTSDLITEILPVRTDISSESFNRCE